MSTQIQTIQEDFRTNPVFTEHQLDENCSIFLSSVPEELLMLQEQFSDIWEIHPAEHHEIWMVNKFVKIPRWQAAFGATYHFSGNDLVADPVPAILLPWLDWVRINADDRLNGILVNWYEGPDHHIGRHRDSTNSMCHEAPIVTISFGAARRFRMRPYKGKGFLDFPVTSGSVILIPQRTNSAWTHEVPKPNRSEAPGRRISLTFRAFEQGVVD